MSYITLSDFKLRAGLASDSTFDTYLTWILQSFSSSIDKITRTTFSYQTSKTSPKLFGYSNGITKRTIGAWQESGLVVTYYSSVGDTGTVLTKDTDYILEYPNNQVNWDSSNPLPVVSIRLFGYALTKVSYLVITGTFGYASSLPADLERALYFATLTAYTWNKYQGNGLIQRDKIENLETFYAVPPEYLVNAANLASGNLESVPSLASALYSYAMVDSEVGMAM